MSSPPTPPKHDTTTIVVGPDEMIARIRTAKPELMQCPVPPGAGVPQATPAKPTHPAEQNLYQSAGALMRRLADTVTEWRTQVPHDAQPAILAILHGGVQINVSLLAEESFHGIRVEGTLNGAPCMLLAHQSSIQLLCYVAKVEPEAPRRTIGFIIDGETREI
ncbi:hypothetical protein [Denitromonas halophila]|uniref:Uncharacterized protein n=1 Tax=Denitromonas halophila TaxID=1629404 RepID=A0A557QQT8_9RHOO|nr:hypothetical protein [Denitromonas halophila]TVO55281.1 hypothetical protein FHP91_12410 [Denitromonas halophila]